MIADHPRLGALILGLSVAERVALADRLASIGRTSARARVGSLICEIVARMRRLGAASDNGYVQLPLTQEDIGDATGLTSVHVNRMMRALVDDGIIERERRQPDPPARRGPADRGFEFHRPDRAGDGLAARGASGPAIKIPTFQPSRE